MLFSYVLLLHSHAYIPARHPSLPFILHCLHVLPTRHWDFDPYSLPQKITWFYLISIFISSPIYVSYTANLWTMRQSCICCNVTWHYCPFIPFLLYGTIRPCLWLCLCSYNLTSFTPISLPNATYLNSISTLTFCFEMGWNLACYNNLEYNPAQTHLPLQTWVHWQHPPFHIQMFTHHPSNLFSYDSPCHISHNSTNPKAYLYITVIHKCPGTSTVVNTLIQTIQAPLFLKPQPQVTPQNAGHLS
jgi:hypothetical protein